MCWKVLLYQNQQGREKIRCNSSSTKAERLQKRWNQVQKCVNADMLSWQYFIRTQKNCEGPLFKFPMAWHQSVVAATAFHLVANQTPDIPCVRHRRDPARFLRLIVCHFYIGIPIPHDWCPQFWCPSVLTTRMLTPTRVSLLRIVCSIDVSKLNFLAISPFALLTFFSSANGPFAWGWDPIAEPTDEWRYPHETKSSMGEQTEPKLWPTRMPTC